nr:RNA-directed DNA polymerase, eukaryota [Tanacetum cinerariifolium]
MENIDICNVKLCWGNSSFDYICGPSVGNSGGILCVWDPFMFEKHNSTTSDYFVAIRGDFNEVCTQDERFGSIFNIKGAAILNSFIASSGLVDVPMGVCSFTWVHKSAAKMSKLDRFFISEGLMESCPNISAITLDRYLSDHRPILLRELCFDYGPYPFRFYHFWFELEGFDKFVDKLIDIDKTIDAGYANSDLLNNRKNVITSLLDMEKLKSLEVAQKAKIKWSIEGDENSKFFHVILNKKRNNLAIRGILVDGVWIDSPSMVKDEFLSHFKNGFDCPSSTRLSFDMNFPNQISSEVQVDLEKDVSLEELKRAIWDCGGNSSFIALIPKSQNANMVKDFRPISLIGSLYKIIAKILANCLVGVLEDIVSDVQSAFVAVDFEKAFESVRWDYLDEVLKKFSFGDRWCGWIHSCLRSSKGSILVNGCPTKEFQFHKGLKQGDPLSLFLFILIMESLHLSFQNVVNACMFMGVSIGSNLHLSHLFYAGDVVFLGQWSDSNISTIIKVLKCFFCASDLSINMHKSKLMGIAVDDDIVNQAAHSIGCLQLKPPFSYLGSTPIYYMSLFKVPSQVLKMMEFIYSRFFNGIDIMEKKLSFISWNKVLASKDRGGLGVSSFFAMNRALMFKWVWRFKTDSTSLWTKFILAMHGKDGNLNTTAKSFFPSIWLDIIRDLHNLKNKGIDLLRLIKKKIGNGVDTLFWKDTWKGDIAFKFMYPRIYKLETCKQINVASKLVHDNVRLSLRRMPRGGVELEQFTDMINSLADLQLPNMQDRWFWSLSCSGNFSIASVRKIIDDHLLPEVSSKFSWRKMDIFRNIASWWDIKSRVSSFEEWEMNQVVFVSTIPSKASFFDDIVARSFQCGLHNDDEESNTEAVSDTYFDDNVVNVDNAEVQGQEKDFGNPTVNVEVSSDPFNIYGLLNNRKKDNKTAGSNTTPPFPPGFTPEVRSNTRIAKEAGNVD